MSILITGGAGYIGSYINQMLCKKGFKTIILDNLSKGIRNNISQGIFIKGDINDSKLLDEIFTEHDVDSVMHFAAAKDVGESVERPDFYYQNNVCGTINLLNAMARNSIKSFIFSSSAATFGMPKHKLIKEDHDQIPINPYGNSKLIVEKIVPDYEHAFGIKYCSLRYFNAAGGDPKEEFKSKDIHSNNIVPILIRCQENDNPFTIFGTDYDTADGTCVRDYVHIDDLGQAHILALEYLQKGKPSGNYNLGNGRGYSVRDVINSAEKVMKTKLKIIEGPRREGDPSILICDASKAIQELGWKPQYGDVDKIFEHQWKSSL